MPSVCSAMQPCCFGDEGMRCEGLSAEDLFYDCEHACMIITEIVAGTKPACGSRHDAMVGTHRRACLPCAAANMRSHDHACSTGGSWSRLQTGMHILIYAFMHAALHARLCLTHGLTHSMCMHV